MHAVANLSRHSRRLEMRKQTSHRRSVPSIGLALLPVAAACSGGTGTSASDPVENAAVIAQPIPVPTGPGFPPTYPGGGQCGGGVIFDPGRFQTIPLERLEDIVIQRL